MKIQAILFDLDDTLLDDATATHNYRILFFEKYKAQIPYSFQVYTELWNEQIDEDLKNYAEGKADVFTMRCNRIRKVFQRFDMTNDEAEIYVQDYLSLYRHHWRIFPDVISTLDELYKSCTLAVVSNGDKFQQKEKVELFNLSKYFKALISCEDAHSYKPHSKMFHYACNFIGVKANQCLFIGDGFERDIIGSQRAGLEACWLVRDGNKNNKELKGIYVIQSLTEIPSVIAEIEANMEE